MIRSRVAAIVVAVLVAATSVHAAGKKTYGDVEAIVVEVHDGDTLKVDIPSWPPIIGKGIGVRVYGVDCRELSSGVTQAKDVVKSWLAPGSKIWLFGLRRDKYFRILSNVGFDCKPLTSDPEDEGLMRLRCQPNIMGLNCDPITDSDAFECKDLAEELLEASLAVPYYGKDKKTFPTEIK